jgi:3-hydroxyisobutyrate dehydrogenase-like beta-hydroxyacid dehydrogenase
MGITVALAAKNSGFKVYWASEGRSSKSRERAERISLTDTTTLSKLCSRCTILICVCPPDAAMETAKQVASRTFSGLYIDANAISPQLSQHINQILQEAGIDYVDGGIIGPPAWQSNTTRMYLSGKQAASAAAYFSEGSLSVNVIGESIGQASALKMCYAAYTKGTSALLCAILAAAETLNVR